MKSINDISDELGVTKTAVFQHIKRDKPTLKPHIKFIKNKEYLDSTGYKILIKTFHRKHEDLHSNYQRMSVYLLRKAVKDKDNQIANLNTELKQSQALQLNSQKEIESMKQELKLSNKSQRNYQRHGFFWRLFH